MDLPDMTPVVSSQISAIGWADEKLYVCFSNNGAVYVYDDVPEDVSGRLINSASVGSEFHALIRKGGYTYRRIA